MEMEPESVSETSWYPEIVPLMRDVKMRLFVKKEGCLRRHVSMGIELASDSGYKDNHLGDELT